MPTVAIGQATETDLAQTFSRVKRKTLGLATETDSAVSIRQILMDDFSMAYPITGLGQSFVTDIIMFNATLEPDEVYFPGVIGTIWFYWDSGATPQGGMEFSCGSLAAPDYDMTIRVFTQGGTGLAGLVEVFGWTGDPDPADLSDDAVVRILTTANTRYYVQVGTKINNTTEVFIGWDSELPPSAPSNNHLNARGSFNVEALVPTQVDGKQMTTATLQGTEQNVYTDTGSIWYNMTWFGWDDEANTVIHLTTDDIGDASGIGDTDTTLTLFTDWNGDELTELLPMVANDDIPNEVTSIPNTMARLKVKVNNDLPPYGNNFILRVGSRQPVNMVYVNAWLTPPVVNDEPEAAISLIDTLTLTHDTSNATISMGEYTALAADDPETGYLGSLWYTYTSETAADVTFTYTEDAGEAWSRIKIYTGSPLPLVDPDDDLPDDLIGLTEVDDSGDGSPLATLVFSVTEDVTYYVQVLSMSDGDHTLTWDLAGVEPAVEAADPDETGSLSGNADVQLVFASHADLAVQGSVVTTTPIRVRPMLGVEIEMPTPAIVNGKPIVPLYWSKPASSMTATVGVGHIVVVPDADPASQPGGATVTDNWPAGGKPDYWWTVRDLTDPGAGNFTHISTWPEHFGGPSLTSSGNYRPRLQHRDHFGAGGRKHTYTKAVVFNPDQVDHMWVDLGSNLTQPYTVMMAGIILSYPKRTYGHYLLDAGKATPVKDTNKDWTINDNLSYRSLMLFQLHSALICTRDDTDDGVIARVPHNYRLTPRVFMGIFHGNSSRVGYFDTREKKVAKGRTDNRSVRKLVIGRRTNSISDNLASHMVLFEVRIWSAHLTPAQYRAQYKQMAALYKFNLYDKDGV